MLAITPLRSNNDGNNKGGATDPNFSIGTDDFMDFTGSNLLDSIDFNDLFMGMHDGDILPDLEMDPDLLAEFSLSNNTCGGDESSDINNSSSTVSIENNNENNNNNVISPNSDDGNLGLFDGYDVNNNFSDNGVVTQVMLMEKEESLGKSTPKEEIWGKKDVKVESIALKNFSSPSKEGGEKGKKSSSSNLKSNSTSNNNNSSNNQAKRKTKVDWTPELHRRFVQAVEQLGVDKAVPSRILELMGIDCLTRHNIASHLQKYRSHRKHLQAREAEAANWTQKRQMYGVAMGGGKGGGSGDGNIRPWYPPTMGFPPMTTMHPSFRPLHVWGHPTMDPQSRMSIWPKQIVPSTGPLPLGWATPPPLHPPLDPSFWQSSHQRRVGVAPVPGLSLHPMFRADQYGLPTQPQPQSSGSYSPLDLHPSKESIDAAIGDILAKPWQPLPIGLKPPSMDTVLVELQRQGIPKIPPST